MKRTKRCFVVRVYLLIFSCLICEMAVAQSTSQNALEKVAVYPSLIVVNGKIATMDKNLSFHQAMAIRGETIWKLGTNQEIRELAGPHTDLVDLQGRTVVPGLIESHTHPQFWVLWHLAPSYDVQLDHLFVKGDTIEQVKSRLGEAIQRRLQQTGPQKWVLVNIPWQMNPEMEKAGVNRQWLDQIAPQAPVAVLTGYAGGFGNTRLVEDFKAKLGYEPPGGLRIWYDGSWGVILRGRTEVAAEILRRELEEMVSFGITAVGTHGEVNTEVLNALRFLEQKGQLPLRFAWSHESGFFGKEPVEFYRLLGNFLGMGSNYLWNFGVGLEAWPTDPNHIQYQAQMAAVEAGLRLVDVHGNSDQVLDAIFHMMDTILGRKTRTLEQIRAMGHGFDHGNRIRPEQVPMLARYNFWMSFQGSQFARSRMRLE
ncbi:MAG: amidohydrolase family protein, partial [Acidobacteria bacterium]|nr:amidohydrolase family protein [Acidobacteriota bacterium]